MPRSKKLNPFSDEYFFQELEFYGEVHEKVKSGTVCLSGSRVVGRCDDYFTVNFRILDSVSIPMLKEGTRLWMSLTPMEIQSMWVPLEYAEGLVGAGGLGLGYFALRAASKSKVSKVLVIEQNRDVIKIFRDRFADRPEYKKIEIVQGDVREKFHDHTYDMFFMDVYESLLDDECFEDFKDFSNYGGKYRFWGQELILHQAIYEVKEKIILLTNIELEYFKKWEKSPSARMRSRYMNPDAINNDLEVIGYVLGDNPNKPARKSRKELQEEEMTRVLDALDALDAPAETGATKVE